MYLSLEEINSNPIYQPPIEWVFDIKKIISSKFRNKDVNSQVVLINQIEDFEKFSNDLKHKIIHCYKNYTSKYLKDRLKIIRPDDYSKLCKEHRQMGLSPYYYDLVKLYSQYNINKKTNMDKDQVIKKYDLFIGKNITYCNDPNFKIVKFNKTKFTIFHKTKGSIFLGYENYPDNSK